MGEANVPRLAGPFFYLQIRPSLRYKSVWVPWLTAFIVLGSQGQYTNKHALPQLMKHSNMQIDDQTIDLV